MISSNDFRNGMAIEVDGEVFIVVEYQHVKPGKGPAFVRTKMRNIRTGSTVDHKFSGGEKVQEADVRTTIVQYLYQQGDEYVFMDSKNYEQYAVDNERIKNIIPFLKEGQDLDMVFYKEEVMGAQLPSFVVLQIVEAPPGAKGNTVSGATKEVKLETGHSIQVPLFVEQGEKIKIDTRTGQYVERIY